MNDEDTEWKVWRCGGQQSRIDKETKQEQNTYVYTNSSISHESKYSHFIVLCAGRMKKFRLYAINMDASISSVLLDFARLNKYLFIRFVPDRSFSCHTF